MSGKVAAISRICSTHSTVLRQSLRSLRLFGRFYQAILLILRIDQTASTEAWHGWLFLAGCDYLGRRLGHGQWIILRGALDVAVLGQLNFLVVGSGAALVLGLVSGDQVAL